MAIDKEIGRRIKELRIKKDWSQADLAEKSKVKQATISYIESGARNINKDNLMAISKALGVTPNYILTGTSKEIDTNTRITMLEEKIAKLDERLEKVIKLLSSKT